MKTPKSLSDALPTDIELAGKNYPVNFAFDNVIQFFNLLDPQHLTERRMLAAFFLLVPSAQANVSGLTAKQVLTGLNQLVEYINYTPYSGDDGDQMDITGQPLQQAEVQRYYDYDQDSMAIYASFKQVYGMDLWDERGRLHWTKFQALLLALPDNCLFKQIIGIRQSNPKPPTNGNSAELQEYTRQIMLKHQYALKTSFLERLQALDNEQERR